MRFTMLLVTGLVLQVSCSKLDDFDRRTKDMNDSTQKMKDNLETMYQQQRSAMSLKMRNDAYDLLLESKGMNTKIAGASMYMQSFEFQNFTDQTFFDKPALKEELFNEAIDEFSARLSDLYVQINPEKMSLLESVSDSELSFYALSTVLHVSHHYQNDLQRKSSRNKSVSLLDLITNAFMKEKNGSKLENYEMTILGRTNRSMYLNLLKARTDVLAMMGLKLLTENTLTEGETPRLKISVARDLNNASIVKTEELLGLASMTKSYLGSIGVKTNLDPNLVNAFKAIEYPGDAGNFLESKSSHDKTSIIRSIIQQLTAEA